MGSVVTKRIHRKLPEGDQLVTVLLNRPEAANAFSAEMMAELTAHFSEIKTMTDVRAVVICGAGKHFSAGADLNWMKQSAALDFTANIADAGKLTAMFEALKAIPQPVVAAVKGAVFGGAVGLVACADAVVCDAKARFCLSEVKLGLLPAVIVPYLARRMRPGSLRRYGLSAQVFGAEEAMRIGLVDVVAGLAEGPASLKDALHQEVSALLLGGPGAQQQLKKLLARVELEGHQQGQDMASAIAGARTSAEGQAGLAAFFAKQQPIFVREIPDDWELDQDAP